MSVRLSAGDVADFVRAVWREQTVLSRREYSLLADADTNGLCQVRICKNPTEPHPKTMLMVRDEFNPADILDGYAFVNRVVGLCKQMREAETNKVQA